MLGPEGVLQATVIGGRGPLERVELRPFGDRRAPVHRPLERPWPGQIPPPSPTLVFAQPPPVELCDREGKSVRVDGRGELSGEPATIVLEGSATAVTAWAGPWPVDERWWECSPHWRRARFQVVAGDRAYLVALCRGAFLLEGEYG
jgi:protein ImuB